MAKEGKDVGKKSKASVKTPEVKPKSTSKKSSDEANSSGTKKKKAGRVSETTKVLRGLIYDAMEGGGADAVPGLLKKLLGKKRDIRTLTAYESSAYEIVEAATEERRNSARLCSDAYKAGSKTLRLKMDIIKTATPEELQTLHEDVKTKIAAHEKKLRFYYNQKALIDYQLDKSEGEFFIAKTVYDKLDGAIKNLRATMSQEIDLSLDGVEEPDPTTLLSDDDAVSSAEEEEEEDDKQDTEDDADEGEEDDNNDLFD